MFDKCYKLHDLKSFVVNGVTYYLCYFWEDESIFSPNYRRCFVFIPQSKFFPDIDYKMEDLVDFAISFSLAKYLFSSSEIFDNSIHNDYQK